MEIIQKYQNKPWDWERISENPNITMEIIEKYPINPWSWYGILRNRNITMEIIEKYLNKPWSWYLISENPNITVEFIEKNIDKINFDRLSSNKFTYHNKLVKKRQIRKNIYCLWYMNRDIQRYIISTYLI